MKKISFLLVALVSFYYGCKKDNHPKPSQPNSAYQITLVQGNNQVDTIGNMLRDSIKVKVTQNGAPLKNYTVEFIRSNCDDIITTEAKTSASGQASFAWYLSGTTGGQSLKVILLANGDKQDSITVKATGLTATKGWHRAGCVQNFEISGVAVLSSGRLLASVNANTYPYYSDDNAISWHPLMSFTNSHFVDKIVAGGPNEIFVATDDEGLFYSNDNGNTWSNISAGIDNATGFADFAYTRSGKLIYTDNSGVYISPDKGATWNDASSGLPFGQSYNPCEELNGDLYIIGSDGELYKSTNNGGLWVNLGSSKGNILLASVESLYIDANGDMYLSNPHNGPGTKGGIFKSTNQGATFTNVFLQQEVGNSYPNITNMSKIASNYYFSFAGRGVYQTTDFKNYANLTQPYASYGLLSYTLAKNSYFVIGSPGFGIFYYVQ